MNILHICDNPDVLSVLRIVKICINIVRIAVPIILIIMIMADAIRTIVSGGDDELKKFWPMLAKRCIIALLIFLIPTMVGIIVHMTVGEETTYLSCLENANDEKINSLRNQEAHRLVSKFRSTRNMQDYNAAITAVYKLRDQDTKQSLLSELEAIRKDVEKKKDTKPSIDEYGMQIQPGE